MEQTILTKRPSEMDFHTYREELKAQQKKIKNYLRNGRLCFVSWKIVEFEIPNPHNKPLKEKRISRNPNPFLGSTKNLKFV